MARSNEVILAEINNYLQVTLLSTQCAGRLYSQPFMEDSVFNVEYMAEIRLFVVQLVIIYAGFMSLVGVSGMDMVFLFKY